MRVQSGVEPHRFYQGATRRHRNDTQAYWQFGNSVFVPVVEEIAKAIAASLAGNPMMLSGTAFQINLPGVVAETKGDPLLVVAG